MSAPIHLSAPLLAPFFEAHHGALADELRGPLLEPLAGVDDAATLARRMGELGLYRHLQPKGGSASIDVRSLVLVREALGQVSPGGDAIFAVQGLGTYPIAKEGTDAQRAELLPPAYEGRTVHAFALTEPEAGSDVASLRTTATREGDSFVLRGEKHLISNVPLADVAVVFATVDPALGRKGITAFLLPLGERPPSGVTVEAMPLSFPHPLGRIRLGGVRLPASALLGTPGGGFALAMATLDAFRITVGAAANGMASRALHLALAHVTTRKQFGGPLSDRELVRGMLAHMATELDAARLLVARAAHACDTAGRRVTREAAMAKMFATEAAQRIIDQSLQLHGGLGVVTGSEIEALYREIRPLRIYEGATEVQQLVIAKSLLDAFAGR